MWTCDADGTNCQQLTFFEGPQGGAPRWSPDGRWIAFDSRVEGKAQIYVIPSDGGRPRRVTGGDSTEYGAELVPRRKVDLFQLGPV